MTQAIRGIPSGITVATSEKHAVQRDPAVVQQDLAQAAGREQGAQA